MEVYEVRLNCKLDSVHITSLPNFVDNVLFSTKRYSVSNCPLTTIFPRHFDALFSIVYLKLVNNSLRSIQSDTFNNLTKLEILVMPQNNIFELDEKVFSNLKCLKRLDLSESKLQYLPSRIFGNNQKLEKLILFKNRLKIIESNFPLSVAKLDLRENFCISMIGDTKNNVEFLITRIKIDCKFSLDLISKSMMEIRNEMYEKINDDNNALKKALFKGQDITESKLNDVKTSLKDFEHVQKKLSQVIQHSIQALNTTHHDQNNDFKTSLDSLQKYISMSNEDIKKINHKLISVISKPELKNLSDSVSEIESKIMKIVTKKIEELHESSKNLSDSLAGIKNSLSQIDLKVLKESNLRNASEATNLNKIGEKNIELNSKLMLQNDSLIQHKNILNEFSDILKPSLSKEETNKLVNLTIENNNMDRNDLMNEKLIDVKEKKILKLLSELQKKFDDLLRNSSAVIQKLDEKVRDSRSSIFIITSIIILLVIIIVLTFMMHLCLKN